MKKFKFEENEDIINFYKKEGYVVIENSDEGFLRSVKKIYAALNIQNLSDSKDVAFLNKDGIARHKINMMRNYPLVREIFKNYINDLIIRLASGIKLQTPLYFTHSKLSFKIPNAEVSWFPHQDIGYKDPKEILQGFALMLALEKMDESNGTLELYEGSHKVGRINHDRKKENIHLGDSQMEIDDLSCFPKLTLDMNMGDIVIFSQYMVHSSGISTTNSHRLALISEVEEMKNLKLDDYGKIPIYIEPGNISIFSKMYLLFKSYISFTRYWFKIRQIKGLNKIARKLIDLIRGR